MTTDQSKNEPSTREKKEERTRLNIFDAAESLFNKNGIAQVSVQDIANEALYSRATLYNYFGNKEGLMYALNAQRMGEGNARLAELVQMDMPNYAKLRTLIEVSLEATIRSPSHNEILRHYLVLDNAREKRIEDQYSKYYDKKEKKHKRISNISKEDKYALNYLEQIWIYEDTLMGLISQCMEDGSVRSKYKPSELAYLIIMTLNGIADQMAIHIAPLENYNIDKENLKNLYLEMINKLLTSED